MTRITIKKMKQPVHSSFLKKGMTFYRVFRDGVYFRDFKTKREALKYRKRKKR